MAPDSRRWFGLCGGLLTTLGGVVLLARFNDWPALVTVTPGGAPMAFSTAVAFLLAGTAFIAQGLGRIGWARGLAVLTAVAGAGVLGAYFIAEPLGLISANYVPGRLARGVGFDGRMSPNTAASFLFLGVALAAHTAARPRNRLIQILTSLIMAVAFLAIYGHITGLRTAYSWWRFTGMALHTAIAFFAAAVVLLAAVIRRLTTRERATVQSMPFFAIAGSIVLVVGITAFVSNEELETSTEAVKHGYEVVASVNYVELCVTRMESAERAYMLGRVEGFADFHRDVSGRLRAELLNLQFVVEDDPVQGQNVLRLKQQVAAKREFMQDAIMRARAGTLQLPAQFPGQIGPALMRDIRDQVNVIEEYERAKLSRDIVDTRRLSEQSNRIILVGNVAALGFFVMALLIVRRAERAKAAAEAEILRVSELQRAVLSSADCLVWEASVQLSATTWEWNFTTLPSRLAEWVFGSSELNRNGLWDSFDVPERDEINARSRRAMTEGLAGYTQDFRLIKDGTTHWFHESVRIVSRGEGRYWLVGVVTDITDHKRAETVLRKSEEFNRRIIENSDNCLQILSLDARLLDMAAPGRRLMGVRDFDEIRNCDWFSFWKEGDLAAAKRAVAQALAGEVGRFQGQSPTREGTPKWWDVMVSPLNGADGKPEQLLSISTDITEQKNAEGVLRESEDRFRTAFDYAGIGMAIVGLDGRWLKVNRAICKIVGYVEQELMQKTFQDITHPDDLDADLAHIADLLSGQTDHYQMEKRYFHRSGRVVHVRLTVSLVRDQAGAPVHFISQIEDTTRSKQIERELKFSEERTRLFAEHAPAAMAMFDREMRYLVHSAQWLKDYGLHGRNIIGLSHYEVFPEIGDYWKTVHRWCLAGATQINEADPFDRADGSRQWLSWRVQPWYDDTGAIGGIVMFTEDVTARMQLETELRAARDQALEASRMKSQFLANMSHEIRTPMNGVLGMADLLMDTPLSEEQRQMGRVIRSSADNLLTIINDILDFSRIEAGKLRIEAVEFNLYEQITQTVALLAPRARVRGLTLATDLPGDFPAVLSGDAGRIQQVLVNLVGNAVKFTEKGGVTVAVRARPAAGPGRFAFRVEVRDTGIGVTAEQKSRLFQPFTQADGSTTRKYGGTGLGLAISRQLVQLMDGRIELESEPGRGSVCWFELELPVVADAFAPVAVAESPAVAGPRSTMRLLVAEDNPANQLVIRFMLEKMGLAFDLVGDGEAVLQRLAKGDYAAVIMDCQMPRLDGYEAARRIRAGTAGVRQPRIPIIALTAHAMASDRDKCLAAGMDDYVSKPINREALLVTLRRCGVMALDQPVTPARVVAPVLPAVGAVLDLAQLAHLRSLPGRQGPTLLSDVVTLALGEIPPALRQLDALLERHAANEAMQLAHRLGGSAANLGARELRRVLQELEEAARRPDWEAAARLRPELDRQWQLVRDALERLQSLAHP